MRRWTIVKMNALEFEEYFRAFDFGGSNNYAQKALPRLAADFALLDQHLPRFSGGAVLDMGAARGTGFPLFAALKRFDEIWGAEYSGEPTEIVIASPRERIAGKRIVCNIEKDDVPLPDGAVDFVCLTEVIEHLLYDPMWALLEANRVLKSSGHIFVTTPNLNAASAFSKQLAGRNPNLFTPYRSANSIYERHNREYTIDELKLLLGKAGFQMQHVATHPPPPLKLSFAIKTLRRLAGLPARSDELGDFMQVLAKKVVDVDREAMQVTDRFPAPVYFVSPNFDGNWWA